MNFEQSTVCEVTVYRFALYSFWLVLFLFLTSCSSNPSQQPVAADPTCDSMRLLSSGDSCHAGCSDSCKKSQNH